MYPASDNRGPQNSAKSVGSKAAQSALRLSDTEKGITAKIEKDNYVRISLEEEQEETEGNRKGRKKREEVEWKREKDPQSVLEKSGVCLPEKKN